MPKRPCPDDSVIQPVKKQQISKLKSRKIRSSSSERTLQLLYQGVSKCENNTRVKDKDSKLVCGCGAELSTIVRMMCTYCEHDICQKCMSLCYKCNDGFCSNCCFPTYDHNEAVCYSCYC